MCVCVYVVCGTSVVVACFSTLSPGLLGARRLGGAGMSSSVIDGATYRKEALSDPSFRFGEVDAKLV